MSDQQADSGDGKPHHEGSPYLIEGRVSEIETRQRAQEKQDNKYKNRQLFFNFLLVVVGAVGLGVSAYQVHMAWLSADAASRAAKIAEDALESNNESFWNTWIEMKSQGRAMQRGARAAQQSANVARDALTSAQRAFVIFGKSMQDNAVLVAGPPPQITQWEFRPRLENSGSTPTRNAHNHANFLPVANLPDNFQFPDIGNEVADTRFVLGPKESTTGALLAVPFQAVNASRTGNGGHIFFWGWARYRDVFMHTPEHMSMFCIELVEVRTADLEHPTPATAYNMSWQLCGRNHNCGDDECDGEPYGNGQIWHSRRP